MTGKILPLYVLAKEIKPKTTTESGLLLPGVIKQPTITAEVVAIGGSTKYDDMQIAVGDKILFGPNSFSRFVHPSDKEEYLRVAQKDVLLYAW